MNAQIIKEALKNYLSNSNTNNAFMITGKWGSGKTFFLKNTLIPFIQKNFKLKVIYVSLNGTKNIEQLQKNVIVSRYALEDNITQEETKKSFLPNFLSDETKENFRNVLKKSPIENKNINNLLLALGAFNKNMFKDCLICFDDLERVSKDFRIEDVIGFINSEFIEHNGIKVIIIGDETKNELELKNYQTAKEKIIGWTVNYKPTIGESIHDLVEIFNANSNKNFYYFLRKREDFIIKTTKALNYDNLRTILFTFDCLKVIHNQIENTYEDLEEELIYFSFCIAQELKNGSINLLGIDTFKSIARNPRIFYQKDDAELTSFEKSHKEYTNKYIFNNFTRNWIGGKNYVNYTFFTSVFHLITEGYLDLMLLNKQLVFLRDKYSFERGNNFISDISRLSIFPYLKNNDFIQIKKNVEDYIKSGQLDIYLFTKAAYSFFYLAKGNFIADNVEDLEAFLLEHIEKTQNNTPVNYKFNNENYEVKEIKENLYAEHIFRMYNLDDFTPNFKEKLESVYNNLKYNSTINKHLEKFKKWDSNFGDDFEDVFVSLNIHQIVDFINNNIENRNQLEQLLSKIKNFYIPKLENFNIKGLIKEIENAKSVSLQPIDKYWYQEILNELYKIDSMLVERNSLIKKTH